MGWFLLGASTATAAIDEWRMPVKRLEDF
jgi:hypothetical protein